MEAKYDLAVEKYYQYKKKYEEEREKLKEKLFRNNNLSNSEKRERLKNQKRHCLFCNRKVNMNFYKEKRILYATCGDTSDPCEKRIEIKTSEYLQIEEIIHYFSEDINDFVEKIINNKTKYLLNVDDNEELLASFEEYLELYNETNEINNSLKKKFENFYVNSSSEEMEALKIELDTHKEKIKTITKEYTSMTKNDDKMLTEITNIYKDHIIPIEDKINKLRFKERVMSINPKEYRLNMYNHLLKETETIHSVDDPEILRFDVPFDIPGDKRKKQREKKEKGTKQLTRKNIDCEVKDESFCKLKFNDEEVDYTRSESQNFDCDDKRLSLKIHPDKNRGCEDCANEVFKIYQDKCLEK